MEDGLIREWTYNDNDLTIRNLDLLIGDIYSFRMRPLPIKP